MTSTSTTPALGRWGLLLTGAMIVAATMFVIAIVLAMLFKNPGWDTRYAYLQAAEAVVDGRSPYPAEDDPSLEEENAYVYPPQLAIVFVPLTALPVDLATAMAILGSLVALLATLAVVGVRDWRCYVAVLLWAPAWNSIENANISAGLTLLVALAWRYRETVWPLAVTLGLAVSTKLFLWPLLVWTVVTRGARVAGLTAAVGVGVTFAAWAVIGFAGLAEYPTLLSRLSELQAERSYSLVGIADTLGLGPEVGRALMLTVGGALLGGCVYFGRLGDDRRSFTCAIAAALAMSPIVWQHYLAFLIVPLALARPRFSAVWLLPIALWLSPRIGHGDGLQPFLPALVVGLLLYVLLARPRTAAAVAEAV